MRSPFLRRQFAPPPRLLAAYAILICFVFDVSSVWAARKSQEDLDYDVEPSSFFYQMVTGKFGAFLIVFMGFGGVATIFMTRQGKSSTQVPLLGIVMLLVGAIVFGYRVMINAGMFGAEHIRW